MMYASMANCMNYGLGSFDRQMPISSHSSSSTYNCPQPSSTPKILLMAETTTKIDHSVHRRTANYKPNIWKGSFLQSLRTKFSEKEDYERRVHILREEVACTFAEGNDPLSKLELVDSISKLGLDKYFEKEIKQALDTIAGSKANFEGDLYSTAKWFRLLRHYGRNASQEMFTSFVDEAGKFMTSQNKNPKALLELFEASNMATEGENILNEARLFSIRSLTCTGAISDGTVAKQVFQAMRLPWQWSLEWYNVKKHINAHEERHKGNTKLVELSKLNFNLVQSSHQEDLKEVFRWWNDLGINGKLSFSRDRIVESFLFATGIAPEAEYGSLRKWLTKASKLILIIDDVYDIYGSLEELECFTNAVKMWRPEEVKDLPEPLKIHFWALLNTTEQMAAEIQQEKGWTTSVLPFLQNMWADLCKSFLLEAKWYNAGHIPSLQEYLDNGWISSTGPLLALLAILGVADENKHDLADYLKECRDITYHASIIFRLCNDEKTLAAELERGDAASSILCYMREGNVSEEVAKEHIRSLILRAWRHINAHCINTSPFVQDPVKKIINLVRIVHYVYQNGDGIGVQDGETRVQVLSNFIEPLQIN